MIRRLRNWFGGRSPQPRPIPPQPEHEKDWAVGDRAECIRGDGHWVFVLMDAAAHGPSRGQVLRVAYVYADHLTVWLVFREFAPFSYPAGHFRKLRPCSADFREQLRRPAPVPAKELVE